MIGEPAYRNTGWLTQGFTSVVLPKENTSQVEQNRYFDLIFIALTNSSYAFDFSYVMAQVEQDHLSTNFL